ncbi:UNVERIFIED_CONTAM: plasma membrane calcium [Siphonaria sp. JEL0065]|nr:plasma membrane calcium [Siphonaria sp. JEL0065]
MSSSAGDKEGAGSNGLAVPGNGVAPTSHTNSSVSDTGSNNTFGSWLNADHLAKERALSPGRKTAGGSAAPAAEEVELVAVTHLSIPKPNRTHSGHSGHSGLTVGSGGSQAALVPRPRPLKGAESKEALLDASERGRAPTSSLFGVAPQQLVSLLENRSTEQLVELGGVEGVIARLRSTTSTGLSENRDAANMPWNQVVAILDARITSPVIVFEEPLEDVDLHPAKDYSVFDVDHNTHTPDHKDIVGAFPTSDHHSGFQARKDVFGDNIMPQAALMTLWDFAKEALKDQTLIILIIAAGADVAIGIYKTAFAEEKDPLGFVDGVAIIFAVVVIVLISSVNDFRKQAQFHELSDFSSSLSKVQVVRNGVNIQIKTSELLVGDICHIQAGDVVPADGLVLQCFNLSADESSLTGESVALNKDATHDPFLFSGTKLVNGVGKMVVIATGRNSANGRLLEALENAETEETPLQVKLGGLADLIAKFGTYTAIGMFVALAILYGIFHHDGNSATVKIVNDVINLFIIAVTLVVVAVPEGLPLAVTIALAHATLKMLKDNNLVRHLKACETMGNATTICSDKTGTLTQNRMQVVVGVVGCHAFGTENLSANSSQEGTLHRKLTQGAVGSVIVSPGSKRENSAVLGAATSAATLTVPSNILDGQVARRSPSLADSNGAENSVAAFRKATFTGLPDIVLDHIARSINVNTTAEEVVTNTSATETEVVAADAEKKRGRSPSRKSEPVIKKPEPKTTEFVGSKTEIALLEFTKEKLGKAYTQDRESTDIVEVIPFSSDRKRMSTVVKIPAVERDGRLEATLFGEDARVERSWLFCKGAAELVVRLCDRYVDADGKVVPLTDEVRADYEKTIDTMASCALRTICVAFKPCESKSLAPQIVLNGEDTTSETTDNGNSDSNDDSNLILAAIVGIRDPIRPEVPDAVRDCTRAGVIVRMVTGDNITTARSIAKIAGILPDSDNQIDEYAVLDGPTFRKLSPEMMDVVIPKLRVLARSSPLDKQILVNNLKRLGETVAVTGDGTNDAPALKSADVGFSMGIAGTEMAKEASDIILLDDNFASLSKAIIWGRSVYDSVRKFLQFQLTVNIVAVVLTVVSSFLTAIFSETRVPLSALTAVQLLWVNLIMDTFAALALATDPPTPELLNRAPARKSDPLISYDMWKMISCQSVYQIIVCLVLYVTKVEWNNGRMNVIKVGGNGGVEDFSDSYLMMVTMVFNTFVFCQLFNEVNCRVIGKELNIFKNISKNNLFTAIVGGSVVVQIIIVEFGGVAFKTMHLGIYDWLLCVGLAALSLPLGVLVRVSPDLGKKRE